MCFENKINRIIHIVNLTTNLKIKPINSSNPFFINTYEIISVSKSPKRFHEHCDIVFSSTGISLQEVAP